jgi:hypothetical protein
MKKHGRRVNFNKFEEEIKILLPKIFKIIKYYFLFYQNYNAKRIINYLFLFIK